MAYRGSETCLAAYVPPWNVRRVLAAAIAHEAAPAEQTQKVVKVGKAGCEGRL